MHTLTLQHIDETLNSTVSALMLNEERLCYIIEDGQREVKVPGETRIPAGRYELFARKSGGFFNRYSKRFGHEFVIGFRDVPGFTFILMHIGNAVDNTRGCLLTNTRYHKGSDGNYWGSRSTDAYLAVHDVMAELFREGKVFLDIDRGGDDGPTDPVADDPDPPEDEPPAYDPDSHDEDPEPYLTTPPPKGRGIHVSQNIA